MPRIFSICLLILFCAAAQGLSQGQKLTPSLKQQLQHQTNVPFVVVFHVQPSEKYSGSKAQKTRQVFSQLQDQANYVQHRAVQILKNHHVNYQSFYSSNAIAAKGDISLIQELAKLDEVAKIVWDEQKKVNDYQLEKATSTRTPVVEWGITKILADSVWSLGFTGQNVVIGGQDTGYDWEVTPLKDKYRGYVDSLTVDHNYNWYDAVKVKINPDTIVNPCGYDLRVPCDDNNHGTHTMGTMVGQDSDNAIGVAPGAQWIGCRNMDRGFGSLSSYLTCFDWLLAPTDLDGLNPDPDKAPHVINNSWYCSEEEGCNIDNWDILNQSVISLKHAGVVVVASAGNAGPNCETVSGPPAIFEAAFTVGATKSNDTIANFSSRGLVSVDSSFRMKPNISAPGQNIRSVVVDGNFKEFSGTSMSGPHVAGVVALMISANPSIAGYVEEIEAIIERTAVPKYSDQDCSGISGQDHPNPIYGYGRINALAAVEEAMMFDPTSTHDNNFESDITLSPNPVNDILTIRLQPNAKVTKTMISSVDGVTKYYSNHFLNQISVTNLAAGMYILRVDMGDTILTHSFIKL